MHWKEWLATDPEQRIAGPIYRGLADLIETGERSKGNEPDINTIVYHGSVPWADSTLHSMVLWSKFKTMKFETKFIWFPLCVVTPRRNLLWKTTTRTWKYFFVTWNPYIWWHSYCNFHNGLKSFMTGDEWFKIQLPDLIVGYSKYTTGQKNKWSSLGSSDDTIIGVGRVW